MLRTMMKSKIHGATVTQKDLHYVGSVTVDEDILDAADLLPGELVHIVDVTNGARLETYTIAGARGSGVVGINGAAARLVNVGDRSGSDPADAAQGRGLTRGDNLRPAPGNRFGGPCSDFPSASLRPTLAGRRTPRSWLLARGPPG